MHSHYKINRALIAIGRRIGNVPPFSLLFGIPPKCTEAFGTALLAYSAIVILTMLEFQRDAINHWKFYELSWEIEQVWNFVTNALPKESINFDAFDYIENPNRVKKNLLVNFFKALHLGVATVGSLFVVVGKWRDGMEGKKKEQPKPIPVKLRSVRCPTFPTNRK